MLTKLGSNIFSLVEIPERFVWKMVSPITSFLS